MESLSDTHSFADIFGIGDGCFVKLRPAEMERLNALVQARPILTHGEFYIRATSLNGVDFVIPETDTLAEHNVIAWSRILDGKEVLCAVNIGEQHHAVLYVTIDNALHEINSRMRCLYASEISPAELNIEVRNGKSIRLTIPPHALVIYE
ncbi:hypothetical protein MUK70_00310 [Dyadobacter chenwenxiniae]|uniref:Uncharacterized protein n=1 Tax=Dyadobacter chenwenxiniae TaxID=2906456 RepID=A0A9X1PQE0_9BACT|nr:hypothetical protein [Dyadobacter chenwenxiniae]MCF0063768.1 hypothetical protein [Dyadobacter chenwenxiniae]UON83444.1 hypothetical protein MUK70_00310 [Dyadobacter chenwenxiniae]